MNKTNKLIPIVTIIVIAVIGTLLFSAFSGDDEVKPSEQPIKNTNSGSRGMLSNKKAKISAAERKQNAVRDNYLETTRTLLAKQDTYDQKLNKIEEKLNSLITEQNNVKQNDSSSSSAFDEIAEKYEKKYEKKVKELSKTLEDNLKRFTKRGKSNPEDNSSDNSTKYSLNQNQGNDLPAGLGFDDLPLDQGNDSHGNDNKRRNRYSKPRNSFASSRNEYVTIRPIYSGAFEEGRSKKEQVLISEASFKYKDDSDLFDDEEGSKNGSIKNEKIPDAIPFYTINDTATLFSNTGLTAMLGVVPRNGVVKDPYRFKVITGAENLSSNGHYIGNVKNIIWSGTLKGNAEMSCVRGNVDKVSLVFSDGTISTTVARDDGVGLGYISDKWGKPCISGTLISNATQYLLDRMMASGASAVAEASAATETTTLTDTSGNVVSFVSDDTSKYIGSKALSGIASDTADYIKERQANAIDIVYVPSGQELVIHVEEQIEFDYEIDGRKLNHAQNISANTSFFD